MMNLKLQLVITVLLSMFAQAQTSTGSSGSESIQIPAATHNTWTMGDDTPVLTQASQAWSESVLYSFANTPDGASPRYVTPILDTSGNLYGTTEYGGAFGDGIVFKLTPSATESILHRFDLNGTDGSSPVASLVLYKGNLYGTTVEGGTDNIDGIVFELKHTTKGWTEKILHSFGATGDGSQPSCALTFDTTGNLYGTTNVGGAYSRGTVFELTSSGTEKVLWSLGNGTDGANPVGGVTLDLEGNLYGTTVNGGAFGDGTVFKLTPSGTEMILHSFANNDIDGFNPYAGLTVYKGNLYGTTASGGGIASSSGTVFEMTPSGSESILHVFGGNPDGAFPYGGVVFDKLGNLYGTTLDGGVNGSGAVFKVTP